MPNPGDMVCVLETMAGQKTTYRARILDVSSSDQGLKAKVFAIDFGFTAVVPGGSLFILPRDPDNIPPQVGTLFIIVYKIVVRASNNSQSMDNFWLELECWSF